MSSWRNVFNNIRNYRAHSIFVKCFVAELLLTLLPFFILSIFYYNDTKTSAKKNAVSESSFALYEIGDITDTILNECDMMCTYIANTDRVQMFMVNNWFFERDNRTLGEIDEIIRGLPLIHDYVDSVYVYSEFNNLIYNTGKWGTPEEFTDREWIEDYKSVEKPIGKIVARAKNNYYPYYITIIKPVIIDNDKKGAVVFNINSSKLYETVSTSRYNSSPSIYLTDSGGRIFMSGNGKNFAKHITDLYPEFTHSTGEFVTCSSTDGESYFISEMPSSRFGLRYVNAYPVADYNNSLRRMKNQIALILVILFVLSTALAFAISVFVYKPVDEIIAVLDDPDSFRAEDEGQNELRYIVSNILTHIRANNEMKQELERRLRMLDQSQLKMLQAQINPHFLYNTLETINWMAVELTDSANDVSRAIVSLSKLLRNSVSSSGYITSIESEIEYTNHYLDIIALRYGDIMNVAWELDDGIGEYSIVKICLQPVVENAIYHGIKPKGGGMVTIRGKLFDEYILFEVEDDGVGMDAQTLKNLNERLHSRELGDGGHIGLYNVNHRIRIIYGEEYGLYAELRDGGGMRVGITLPKHSAQ